MKRKIFIGLGLILLVGALLGTYLTVGCYSDGERSGSIIKFSRKGVVFKTWEGEIMQRNFSMPQQDTWHFSVKDDNVANQINDAMAKNQHVVVHYCQKYYKFPWQGDTEYFVDKIIPTEESK